MIENNRTVLANMRDGQAGTVISIDAGKKATKRLADLGLIPGKEIKVLRKTLFSGPVEIQVSGSRLVIGRGLASKIVVEVL